MGSRVYIVTGLCFTASLFVVSVKFLASLKSVSGIKVRVIFLICFYCRTGARGELILSVGIVQEWCRNGARLVQDLCKTCVRLETARATF
jgi:hypothetical protein